MAADPVAVSSAPQLKVATVVWRHGGKLYVTAIAKQSFALQRDGAARPTGPARIERQERNDGAGRLLPDDLAPYVPRGDVWVFGHVAASPDATVSVSLRMLRDGTPLLEKRATITADAGGHAFLGALGPVSKSWPARARRLGAISPALLEGAVVAVPDTIDWAFYQAAPADQQVPWIAPRDVVRLEIASAAGPPSLVELVIPRDVPQAFLSEPGREAQSFTLRPDGIGLDLDQQRAHVVYRARAVLAGEPQRAKVRVLLNDEADLALAGTIQSEIIAAPLPPDIDDIEGAAKGSA